MCTDWIEPTKDVVVTLAALWGGIVAWLGLSTWRRQLKGQTEFQAARGLVMAAYRLREAVWESRSPLILRGEFPKDYDDRTAEGRANGLAHGHGTRWKPVVEALQAFDTAALEAEALWGEPARAATDAVHKQLRELNAAVHAIIAGAVAGGAHFQGDRNFGRAMRSKAYSTREAEDNPFVLSWRQAMSGIEAVAKPHVRR